MHFKNSSGYFLNPFFFNSLAKYTLLFWSSTYTIQVNIKALLFVYKLGFSFTHFHIKNNFPGHPDTGSIRFLQSQITRH